MLDEKQATAIPTPAWAQMPASNCFRRYWKLLLLAAAIVAASVHLAASRVHTARSLTAHHRFPSQAADTHPLPGEPRAHAFWDLLARAVENGRPSFAELERDGDEQVIVYSLAAGAPAELPDVMAVSDDQLAELKAKHRDARTDFEKMAPYLPLARGTRGIVMTAPDNAFAIMATSLRMLRESGSSLPLEIWFWTRDDHDAHPCEHIFPALDARCMFMCDFLPASMEVPLPNIRDSKFLNKIGAVLFSTFEQILFLDNDAFPVTNPDSIFTTAPFTTTGYVLWPDYWAVTSSPRFWDVAATPAPDMLTRASSESGELLINKATHAPALLLTFYYNVYGDKLFYRLLSQGAPGEGDKETWLAAVRALDLPFYQVAEKPTHAGYHCGARAVPVGSIQHHPRDDLAITAAGINRADPAADFIPQAPAPRPLFMHANLPKLDPSLLLDWGAAQDDSFWPDMRRCAAGRGDAHRMWGPRRFALARFGWDVEKAVWDALRWTACEHAADYNVLRNGSFGRPPRRGGALQMCRDMARFYDELLPDEVYSPKLPRIGARKELPWGGVPLVDPSSTY